MVATAALPRRVAVDFYSWMAVVCLLIAFGSFASTYWLQLPAGTFVGRPIVHLHAFLYSAWVCFFLSQALLVGNGHRRAHRAWGFVGVSLATAMVFVGVGAAINSFNAAIQAGYAEAGRAFVIVPVTAVVLFAALFIAAMWNLRRSEWHKRLMLVATISLLQAAAARWFFLASTGGGPGLRPGLGEPPSVALSTVPGLIVDLLIVGAILYDRRTRGRVHPAYLWGLTAVVAVQLLRIPLSTTQAWSRVADLLLAFGA